MHSEQKQKTETIYLQLLLQLKIDDFSKIIYETK